MILLTPATNRLREDCEVRGDRAVASGMVARLIRIQALEEGTLFDWVFKVAFLNVVSICYS
jgi:hypothetical protein